MSYFEDNFPNYDCDENGNIYKKVIIEPFKSNEYKQVLLFDKDGNRRVLGVHQVIAMKYLDYFPGCVVHHKDENKKNNELSNLEILHRSDHSRLHAKENNNLAKYVIENGPPNKGKKMSEEFCKKCSESAKKRRARERNERLKIS